MKSKKYTRSFSAAASAVAPPPTREQIRALAQALWMDRGSPQGCDVEIWLEAERQLRGEGEMLHDADRVDVDRSEAAQMDRRLERIVSPAEQRSPTAL